MFNQVLKDIEFILSPDTHYHDPNNPEPLFDEDEENNIIQECLILMDD